MHSVIYLIVKNYYYFVVVIQTHYCFLSMNNFLFHLFQIIRYSHYLKYFISFTLTFITVFK